MRLVLTRKVIIATERPQALQGTFPHHMRKYEVPVTVDLASGVRRQGYVTGFDGYSILLVRDWQSPVV